MDLNNLGGYFRSFQQRQMFDKTDLADRTAIDVNNDGKINEEDKKILDENLLKAAVSLSEAASEKNISLKDLLLVSNNIHIDFDNDGTVTAEEKDALKHLGQILNEAEQTNATQNNTEIQEDSPQTTEQNANSKEKPDVEVMQANRHDFFNQPVDEIEEFYDTQAETLASGQVPNSAQILQQVSQIVSELQDLFTQSQGLIIQELFANLGEILAMHQEEIQDNLQDIQDIADIAQQQFDAEQFTDDQVETGMLPETATPQVQPEHVQSEADVDEANQDEVAPDEVQDEAGKQPVEDIVHMDTQALAIQARIDDLISKIGSGTTRREAAAILGINTSGAWATKGTKTALAQIYGKDSEYVKQFDSVDTGKELARHKNMVKANKNNKPQLGDVVVTRNADGSNTHSGIVVAVNEDGTYSVAEFNSAKSKDGNGAAIRKYSLSNGKGKDIIGFFPQPETKTSKNEDVALETKQTTSPGNASYNGEVEQQKPVNNQNDVNEAKLSKLDDEITALRNEIIRKSEELNDKVKKANQICKKYNSLNCKKGVSATFFPSFTDMFHNLSPTRDDKYLYMLYYDSAMAIIDEINALQVTLDEKKEEKETMLENANK